MKETAYYKSGNHKRNVLLAQEKACIVNAQNTLLRKKKEEEKYLLAPKFCENCLDIIPFSKKNGRFCSRSCAAIVTNKTKKPITYSKKVLHCTLCSIEFLGDYRTPIKFAKCKECQRKDKNSKARKWRKTLSFKHQIICKVCGKSVLVPKTWVTCGSKDCKIEASVGCRAYPNYRKKLCWFFNPFQNKKILLESSWELELANFLTINNIEWIRPKFIKWVDLEGSTRRYFPDFYLPKYDLYLDPKNPYAMKMGNSEEKMLAISKKVNIVYGDLEALKQKVSGL